jgi:4-amino-4-deoxy-L-arabinose transferase-like glycosyltransferase
VEKLRETLRKRELWLAAAILLAGALLRFLCLGSLPPGLNQDEASIGFDAWSLLRSGMDRNGDAWPVLFVSWGSGQNVLYAYLSIPFLAIFGLSAASLRLCAAFWGSVSLLAFWLLARRSLGRGFGLLALALIALNPWHLMMNRWALESNLLPAFLLLGVWALSYVNSRPWMLCPAAALFALGLYAYGTAFLFLPPFLLGASVHLFRRGYVKLRHYLIALDLFALIALPLALCQLRNALGLPGTKLLWMTLPALTQTRQAATVSFSLRHLLDLGRLLWRQSDALPWNSAGPFGLVYGLPGLILTLLGLGSLLWRLGKGKPEDARVYVLLALLSALFASLFIDVNVNRVNFLFLPLVWCQAEGLLLLWRRFRPALLPCLAALGLGAVLMGRWYVTEGAEKLGPAFHAGLTEAIAYAESLEPEQVWISGKVNMPYIYVLFETKADTGEFLETVRYRNPRGAFRQVSSFGKYRFYGEPPEGVCILPLGEADGETLGVFGGYAVVFRGKA